MGYFLEPDGLPVDEVPWFHDGHRIPLTSDRNGNPICLTCRQALTDEQVTHFFQGNGRTLP